MSQKLCKKHGFLFFGKNNVVYSIGINDTLPEGKEVQQERRIFFETVLTQFYTSNITFYNKL
jgi:hypothetical protein